MLKMINLISLYLSFFYLHKSICNNNCNNDNYNNYINDSNSRNGNNNGDSRK